MRVALIGFGVLGRYVKDVLKEVHAVADSEFVYFDDDFSRSKGENSFPFKQYSEDAFQDARFYVCVGYKHPEVRKEIISELLRLGRTVPHLVHPSSYVHPSVTLGSGSFIYPRCSIDRGTTIGNGVWIVNGSVIAHDCTIGDSCWFGTSVTLSGNVSVGERSFIGAGTTVSNEIRIGSGVVVGLATAVTKDVADNLTVMGNPMRILSHPLKLV